MDLSINFILSIIIAFEATLFSLYIFSVKQDKRLSNVFIAFFIFDFGIESFMPILFEHFFVPYPQFALILDSFFFLQLPALYFYLKSISFKDFKLKLADLLHILPFVVANIAVFFTYHVLPFEEKETALVDGTNALNIVSIGANLVLFSQMIIYFILSFKLMNKYKQIVNENYSNIGKYNYKWIRQLVFIFAFIFVFAIIKNVADTFIMDKLRDSLFLLIKFSILVLTNWVIYIALKRPYIFSGVNSQITLIKDLIKEQEGIYRNSNIEELTLKENELKLKLEACMAKDKPYLNPLLSKYDLAKQLDVSSRELSVFINNYFKKHYYDFINSYRIEEAIKILIDPSNNKLTVLEIMYDVGFNSKSSFNTAFKKHTNLSPTAYKKKHL